MPDRYAVFGNPVAHSQSPWIHARFAEQTGQDLIYEREEVPLDGFVKAVKRFFGSGGRGLNITVPFKEQAWHAVDQRSSRAEHAGAVNTIALLDGGELFGDNTDGVGLLRDLQNHGVAVTGARILILGAGGAVRGILDPLAGKAPASITLANRTPSRADALLPLCGNVPASAHGFDDLRDMAPFDLVINGTSIGLSGHMPPLPDGILHAESSAYDLVYGSRETPFMRWSRKQGAGQVLDGLGMLVEQAAESFLLWRGVRPETAAVIKGLRERLQ